MSTLDHEDLLWRFGKSDDPEVEARRQHILKVLLETSPQIKQEYIDQGRRIQARVVLRQLFVHRQLTPSEDEDARIDACTDLATLRRWYEQAFTAVSVSEALK